MTAHTQPDVIPDDPDIKAAIIDGVISGIHDAAAILFKTYHNDAKAWTSDRIRTEAQQIYNSAVVMLTVIDAKVTPTGDETSDKDETEAGY